MVRAQALIGALVIVSAAPALAQSTNCYTTGYGAQQHLWCNTTPAPDNQGAQQLKQSEANFGSALGDFVAAMAEKHREQQEAKAAQQAAVAAQQRLDQSQAFQRQIEEFAANPAHPYFGLVRDGMAAALRAGQAGDLQSAYDFAVAHNVNVQTMIFVNKASPPNNTSPLPSGK